MNKAREEQVVSIEPNAVAGGDLPTVDGELIEDSSGGGKSVSEIANQRRQTEIVNRKQAASGKEIIRQSAVRDYLLLPFVFLTVALLGGLRVAANAEFVFLKPPLVCLIFATILIVAFFRAGLIRLDGWFSESFSTVKNVANAAVLIALFAATVQIFNSLLPEKGLPFWVFAFCFFWTLLNNLFSVFEAKKLLHSLGGLFGFAFLIKYLVLANLTAPQNESWWRGLFENPAQEFLTFALDLPRFSAATGYIQFFAVIFYLVGLFLVSPVTTENKNNNFRAASN